MSNSIKNNVIRQKSFKFAKRIVKLFQYLVKDKKEFVLSRQILRSGTSIGANVEEADGAISKSDFSSKISQAYKESKETHYWLRLLHETNYLSKKQCSSMLEDCNELCKILFSILKTTRIKKKTE